jgi:tRNA-specific 2-thiouridylase
MDPLAFEHHLVTPFGRGQAQSATSTGSAGGAACGDLIQFRVEVDSADVVRSGFDAEGCGALIAAGSAVATLADGTKPLEAARVGIADVCSELGGVSAAKIHAVELAVDAFHRALGEAATGLRFSAVRGRKLVAMSGGVDSAVAAHMSGAEASVGVTLELWRDGETDAAASCCSHVAVRRARDMAHSMGLPHFTLDLREEFRAGVVDPWLKGYGSGLTPNPCVQCNGRVRIEPMVDLARSLGAEKLVTGHYARLVSDDPDAPGHMVLREGCYWEKDQAYALCRVPQHVLDYLEFPLGGLRKDQVRALAAKQSLAAAETPDSQDLCFLAGVGREAFLARHGGLVDNPGRIVDRSGVELGRHRGTHNHTVGQRRGLGIGGGRPLFVIDTDPDSNVVTVGSKDDTLTTEVLLDDIELKLPAGRVSSARLRHHGPVGEAQLELRENGCGVLRFSSSIERVAAGQIACLLDGEVIIGCAAVSRSGA